MRSTFKILFYANKGKGRTKTERLRGTERTKNEIYHAIGTGLLRCKSWAEFVNHLKANGVEVELVVRRNGSKDLKDLQGMRFKKDGYTFKASQIRRGLSYVGIMSKLNANEEKEQQIARHVKSKRNSQEKKLVLSDRNVMSRQ